MLIRIHIHVCMKHSQKNGNMMCTYMCVSVCVCVYMYVYIYPHTQKEKNKICHMNKYTWHIFILYLVSESRGILLVWWKKCHAPELHCGCDSNKIYVFITVPSIIHPFTTKGGALVQIAEVPRHLSRGRGSSFGRRPTVHVMWSIKKQSYADKAQWVVALML